MPMANRAITWFRPQGPVFAIALLVSVVLGGTIGYHVIEGWACGRAST